MEKYFFSFDFNRFWSISIRLIAQVIILMLVCLAVASAQLVYSNGYYPGAYGYAGYGHVAAPVYGYSAYGGYGAYPAAYVYKK